MTTSLEEITDDARKVLREWAKENPGADPDYDGSLSEIVDGSVPVYTYDLMQMGADNLTLATTKPELGPAFDGEPTST